MTSKEVKEMNEQFGEIRASIDRLDDSIRGNGKPGLTIRIDRLERSRATHNKAFWAILVAAVGVATSWLRTFWS